MPADRKKTTPERQRTCHQSRTQRMSVRLGYREAVRHYHHPTVARTIHIPQLQRSPTSSAIERSPHGTSIFSIRSCVLQLLEMLGQEKLTTVIAPYTTPTPPLLMRS